MIQGKSSIISSRQLLQMRYKFTSYATKKFATPHLGKKSKTDLQTLLIEVEYFFSCSPRGRNPQL